MIIDDMMMMGDSLAAMVLCGSDSHGFNQCLMFIAVCMIISTPFEFDISEFQIT
jgi:hypothetical protein